MNKLYAERIATCFMDTGKPQLYFHNARYLSRDEALDMMLWKQDTVCHHSDRDW